MPARIIDGKALALQIRQSLSEQAQGRLRQGLTQPGLTVIQVGTNPASQVYVRNKTKACQQAGIASQLIALPEEVTESQLLAQIDRLNSDPLVHGILVQLPLPPHIDAQRVTYAIDPRKDVDGFHPENVGLLALSEPRFAPCTPMGIVALLQHVEVSPQGRHAVIVGRSSIVGKPMALLLLAKGSWADATVTVCHSRTTNLVEHCQRADILIAALGQPEAVRGHWIRPGATVIDVGIHRRDDGSLCGDVAFDEVSQVAAHLTPVPGGVGPLTVAMLLKNTMTAAVLADQRSAAIRGEGRP